MTIPVESVTMSANGIYLGDCLTLMQGMETGSVDLTMTSGPYENCRLYGELKFKLTGQQWVNWMIPRVVEMCRVTNGLVFINAAGKVKQWKYSPVVEWLVADLTRHHGLVCGPAPYAFVRVGIPGSGSKHYHRRDWEHIVSFARPECLPVKWSANTVMGHPPKWAPGGAMSNRHQNGRRKNARDKAATKQARLNQWGHSLDSGATVQDSGGVVRSRGKRPSHFGTNGHGEPGANGGTKTTRRVMTTSPRGSRDNGSYTVPVLANPGNVLKINVGGGCMGSDCAHENEAPFPLRLAEFFVRSYCPPGGITLDPFVGSGTVPHACEKWGRKWIGIDVRQSQVDLSKRRIKEVEKPLFNGTTA